jgi:hypothetical protein
LRTEKVKKNIYIYIYIRDTFSDNYLKQSRKLQHIVNLPYPFSRDFILSDLINFFWRYLVAGFGLSRFGLVGFGWAGIGLAGFRWFGFGLARFRWAGFNFA